MKASSKQINAFFFVRVLNTHWHYYQTKKDDTAGMTCPKLIYWEWSGAHNRQRAQWMQTILNCIIYNTNVMVMILIGHAMPGAGLPACVSTVLSTALNSVALSASAPSSALARCAVTHDPRLGTSSCLGILQRSWFLHESSSSIIDTTPCGFTRRWPLRQVGQITSVTLDV